MLIMKKQKYDFGMIGLGTMGRNLVYNMNDHGYRVICFDKNSKQVDLMASDAGNKKVFATVNLAEFVTLLKVPRVIMMLVPAGKVVDEVIAELKPLIAENDLIMDCGNSHFTDTNRRNEDLAESGIHFMGVGISGGELGARYGPSIMPGGTKKVYDRVAKMFEDISAKVNDQPCVTWLGPGSAGHYVKMVHNGIEYGLMQLISEAYHILKVAGGMTNEELHSVFLKWNEGILQSYLMEITANIFIQKDDLTPALLIDGILDSAKQNGTGAWTSEDAMHLQVPVSVIDAAVSMRDLSAYKKEREAARQNMEGPATKFHGDKHELVLQMEQALYFSMISAFAQGMALLQVASKEYTYRLNFEKISAIWRGGCIIRASLLEDIRTVFIQQPDLSNLLLSNTFSKKLMQSQKGIRKIIRTAVQTGIPLPAMMNALAWFDSYKSAWLPANLIQAQRDDFGAHTYQRNDREGTFHTEWNQSK